MLVVWCPDWPIVAAGHKPTDYVAIMYASRVVACSQNSRKYGVKRGLKQREAQGRCPDITLLPRNQTQEAEAFDPVVEVVEQIAVNVEVVRPGVCAVATKGPSKYFGGDQNLANRIRTALTQAGFECRIGIADGLFAATRAARNEEIIESGKSPEYLAPMPVSMLEQPQLADLLTRLGLKTLGDFSKLSPRDVLNRFGNDGLKAHRLAMGKDDHILVGREIPETFSLQTEIDPPAQQVDSASFAARRLANQLIEHLDEKALAVRLISIEIETEHGESRQRNWRHDIGFNATSIADRVRWQLAGWLSSTDEELRPTAGVSLLRLIPLEVVPANGRQNEFWGGESSADIRAARAIDRVRGLIGDNSVYQAVLSGGRGVGEQFQLVAWGEDYELKFDTSQPWPGRIPEPSPTVIHRHPRPVQVVDQQNRMVMVNKRGMLKAEPATLFINNDGQPITQWAGPWLFDERWWDPVTARKRSCFQLVTADGQAVLATFEGGAWFIEAVYS